MDDNQRIRELEIALKSANTYNEAQNEYISRMSHDMRTPLNAIMGFAMLLEEHSDDPDKVRDQARKIQKAGKHLLGIINDVLDMKKFESGTTIINKNEFILEDILTEVCDMINPLVKEKNQKFTFSIDKTLPKVFFGDENYIQQIIINLLSNASKYTDINGQIDFIVNRTGSTIGQIADVCFIVKDNGRGMSKEFQEIIFTPFNREMQKGVADPGGTGLGLTVTKKMVDIMGGKISFKSELGKGTEFTLVIPLEVINDSSNSKSNPNDSYISGKIFEGMKILAAEDNELNAEILSEILKSKGAYVIVEPDGKKAVDYFLSKSEGTFDLILMDIMMPEMDGYEATKLIRSSQKSDAKSIPIIAMTANAFSEDAQKALDCGMNARITKPIDIKAFEKTVNKILHENK